MSTIIYGHTIMNLLFNHGTGNGSALDVIESAFQTGDYVPLFGLTNRNGERKELQTYLDHGPLVLSFYRGSLRPYFNRRLKTYINHLAEIINTGVTVIVVSPEKAIRLDKLIKDSVKKSPSNRSANDIKFEVLYDENNCLAEQFGLQFTLPKSHKKSLEKFSVNVKKINGTNIFTFTNPATYVIDTNGKISWALVPNNDRKLATVDEIVAAVNKHQDSFESMEYQ